MKVVERLAEEWLSLAAYCGSSEFKREEFRFRKHKWTMEWTRLNYAEQGEVSAILASTI